MKVQFSSLIYDNPLPQLRSRQAAFPFLAELDDGTLLAAYQIGEAFESVDGTSYISTSTDGADYRLLQSNLFGRWKIGRCWI